MEFEKALKLFKDIPFFDDFSKEEKRFLASLDCNLVTTKDGETLVREGDIDKCLFILLQGTVRITRDKPPEVTLTRLSPGMIFGEISLIGKRPRTTSVVSEGDVVVLRMDGEMITRLNPLLLNKIKNQLMELLIKRLDNMNDELMKIIR